MEERRERDRRPRAAGPGASGLIAPMSRSPFALRRMLASRRTLRQAVLLYEILGEPKGLERQMAEISGASESSHVQSNGQSRDRNGTIAGHADPGRQPRDRSLGIVEGPNLVPEPSDAHARRAAGASSTVASVLRVLTDSARTVSRALGRAWSGP